MILPNITTNRIWTPESVRQVCIANDLYTRGDCAQYERMLNQVRDTQPTYESLYLVAKDIQEHSREQTITNVMFILENDAVKTVFLVDGRDDI